MPEKDLDVHELGVGLEEARRIGVAELVGRDLLVESRAIE